MRLERVVVCACVASAAAWPTTALAQRPPAIDSPAARALSADAMAFACVDPADALARRSFQNEPCRLPLLHLPVTVAGEPTRWPAYPPRSPAVEGGHPMFWRFPVQPIGPHEAPRHSWR